MNAERTARGLGWFSIGLGLAEVFATKRLSRALQMKRNPALLRFYGLREIVAGVGILTRRRPAPWLWARVGGDLMDLAALTGTLAARKAKRGRIMSSLAAVAGVTALDVICGRSLGRKVHAELAAK